MRLSRLLVALPILTAWACADSGDTPASPDVPMLASSGSQCTEPPDPPVLHGDPGDGVVTLTWTSPACAEYFDIFRSTTDKADPAIWDDLLDDGGQQAPHEDWHVTNDVTYYYWVVAESLGAQRSDPSNRVTVTPHTPPPPPPPPDTAKVPEGFAGGGDVNETVYLFWDLDPSRLTEELVLENHRLPHFPSDSELRTINVSAGEFEYIHSVGLDGPLWGTLDDHEFSTYYRLRYQSQSEWAHLQVVTGTPPVAWPSWPPSSWPWVDDFDWVLWMCGTTAQDREWLSGSGAEAWCPPL